MVLALREHEKRQDAERADAGERWEDTGFVFTTRQGRPMSPYTPVKYWHDVRAAAGLGTLQFHDLRHTAVSQFRARRPPRTSSGREGRGARPARDRGR